MTLDEQIEADRRIGEALTFNEAARRAGISSGSWSNIESGRRADPSLFRVARIARALKITVDDLLEGVEEPPPRANGWQVRREIEGNMRELFDAWARERGEFKSRDTANALARRTFSLLMLIAPFEA
jgi:transcriptional regulator with XRE-family HTH domain